MRLLAVCSFAAMAFCATNVWSSAWSSAGACPGAPPAGRGLPELQQPVAGELTDGFGMRPHPILMIDRMHTGVDYVAEAGTRVHASAAGEVVFADRDGAYGNRVVIAHGGGIKTAYAHLLRIDVKPSDCVAQGVVIGTVGATGLATRDQLHFELLRDGRFIDPAPVLARSRP